MADPFPDAAICYLLFRDHSSLRTTVTFFKLKSICRFVNVFSGKSLGKSSFLRTFGSMSPLFQGLGKVPSVGHSRVYFFTILNPQVENIK